MVYTTCGVVYIKGLANSVTQDAISNPVESQNKYIMTKLFLLNTSMVGGSRYGSCLRSRTFEFDTRTFHDFFWT